MIERSKPDEPPNGTKFKAIQQALENSDIVWPKYGSETIAELAARILKKLDSL